MRIAGKFLPGLTLLIALLCAAPAWRAQEPTAAETAPAASIWTVDEPAPPELPELPFQRSIRSFRPLLEQQLFEQRPFSRWERIGRNIYLNIGIALFLICLICFSFLLGVRNGRGIKKIKALFSILPFQAGVTDYNGKMLFYRSTNSADSALDEVPRTVFDLQTELQVELRQGLKEVFSTGNPASLELSIFGGHRKLDFWLLPEDTFNVPAVMWIVSDVTQLHQAHASALRLEYRFRKTLESIVDAVIGTDFDGEITLANPAAENLCGVDEGALLGRKFEDMLHLSGTGVPDGDSALLSVVTQTGVDLTLGPNCSLTRIDGQELRISGTLSPIRSEGNIIIGTVFSFRDVTEEHRKQQQLKEVISRAESEAASSSVSRWQLEDEVRPPLNELIAHTELLCKYFAEESKFPNELKVIKSDGLKLLSLLDRFCDCDKRSNDSAPAETNNAVIIVDDIAVNQKVMGKLFDRLNIPHIDCTSAEAALNEISRRLPRAVFTDLWMPEIGGDELAKRLSGDPRTASLPVFLMTEDTHLAEELRACFRDVIFKPVSSLALRQTLMRHLPDLIKPEPSVSDRVSWANTAGPLASAGELTEQRVVIRPGTDGKNPEVVTRSIAAAAPSQMKNRRAGTRPVQKTAVDINNPPDNSKRE